MSQPTQPVDQESQPSNIRDPVCPSPSQPVPTCLYTTFVRILNRAVLYRTVEFYNEIYADIIAKK